MARLHCLLAVLLLAVGQAGAQQRDHQPNGLFLVAKPSLADPNFARTVVLVTQADDASTVGVIVNRPTRLRPQQVLPTEFPHENYRQPIFSGGPVMRHAIVAVFRSESAPEAPAFHVLKGVYFTMHPENIRKLLAEPSARYRLYLGFSGWAPRQLESEFMRDGWYVLPADEATVFRSNTEGLWEELLEKARRLGPRTRKGEMDPMALLGEALQ